MRGRTVEVLAVALLGLAACGDDGGSRPDAGGDVVDAAPGVDVIPDAPPREVIMQTVAMEVDDTIEVGTMTGGANDRALIVMTAPTPTLSFNIHSHPSGGTVEAVSELNKQNVEYIFVPPSQATWFLLLRNDGGTAMNVELRVELHDNMQWSAL
ncbi:MAG TPA: hypothetical protein VGM90_26615 [Kofleriaceae bacterium]|jgi:hypothetical protein